MKRRSPVRAAYAVVLALLIAAPAALVAVVPDDEGLHHLIPGVLHMPVLITECPPPAGNECPGEQWLSYVDGDMAVYIADSPLFIRIAYYDFFSGATNYVPKSPDAFSSLDYWAGTSGGRIVFSRLEDFGPGGISTAILVYHPSTGTTAEVKRYGPTGALGVSLGHNAIGGNTVAYVEQISFGDVWVANLADLAAGPIQLTHDDAGTDARGDLHPAVTPSGDLIVWESCVPVGGGNCDIGKATLNGGIWTTTALTSGDEIENNPSTDGVLIAYSKRPAGSHGSSDQQDICWQPVAGGVEQCLELDGHQEWPSVSGGLIAFSGVPPDDSELELYVYHVATNRLFRMTSRPGIRDDLASVTALPDGRFRVVWSSRDIFDFGSGDVLGVTFTLPDIDAPVINCETADGQWHPDNVSLACTAEDVGSGLADEGDESFDLTTNVADGDEWADAFTNSRQICDTALPDANCATAGPIGGNRIDRRDPSVSVLAPAASATYTVGQVVTADYSCQDGGSGIQSCSAPVADGQPIDTSSAGPKSFQVTGTDNVGNSAAVNVPYTVTASTSFTFGGFLPPVDPYPTFNSMKAGAAVAVKFSLGGFRGMGIFAPGYPKSAPTACGGSNQEDPVEQTVTAGNSGLQYDAATDTYSYIWKTEKGWAGTCRQLKIEFTDGTVVYANFKLK